MAFKVILVSQESEGVVNAAAEGEATAADFPVGQANPFETLLGPNWHSHRVLLEMEGVPYVDSSAIGWLIGAQKDFRAAGGMLVLHTVQPPVCNVLKMLKIERVVPIASDAAEGRALLAVPAKGPKRSRRAHAV